MILSRLKNVLHVFVKELIYSNKNYTSIQMWEIEIKNNKITFPSITVIDPFIVQYLEDMSKEKHEEVMYAALKIGFHILSSQTMIEQVNQLEKVANQFMLEFEKKLTGFDESLLEYLGEEGHLKDIFEAEGPNSIISGLKNQLLHGDEGFSSLINPFAEESPLSSFRTQLFDEINSLRDLISGTKARAEERELSHLKGEDFEHDLCELFEELSRPFGDVIEHVGREETTRGKKVGDIVIGVRDEQLKGVELVIVVEAKDQKNITIDGKTGLRQELSEAISNRDADFALGVVKYRDSLPKSVPPLRFYRPNIVICCADDKLILEVAYHFCRSVAITNYISSIQVGKEIDWENAMRFISYLKQKLEFVETLRKDIRSINSQLKNVVGNLSDFRDDILCQLKVMETSLLEQNKN